MAKTPLLSNSGRFFSAFQRYISHTSSPHPRIHNRPSTSPYFPKSRSHNTRNIRRYASPAAAHAPHPTSTRQPDTPILYNLFPQTLPAGPPPHGPFVIDTRQLRKEFLQLQARAHPDRHSGPDKAKAEGTSALINEAYKTLQDPLRRAQYLLSLRGIDVAEDERLKVEDPELLMEVLEVREAIEAAQEEGELEGMKMKNERNIAESEARLDRAFRHEDIEGAKDEAVRLRYWTNIKESLDGWERGKPVVLVH
ncbi:molecular chaperone HscB, partial [Lecanoromycetidae sp. Uapishka_2]